MTPPFVQVEECQDVVKDFAELDASVSGTRRLDFARYAYRAAYYLAHGDLWHREWLVPI